MCNADVGILTFKWADGEQTEPDFNTRHKCRRFERIWSWAKENEIDMSHVAPNSLKI
jgi:hypothetical protein